MRPVAEPAQRRRGQAPVAPRRRRRDAQAAARGRTARQPPQQTRPFSLPTRAIATLACTVGILSAAAPPARSRARAKRIADGRAAPRVRGLLAVLRIAANRNLCVRLPARDRANGCVDPDARLRKAAPPPRAAAPSSTSALALAAPHRAYGRTSAIARRARLARRRRPARALARQTPPCAPAASGGRHASARPGHAPRPRGIRAPAACACVPERPRARHAILAGSSHSAPPGAALGGRRARRLLTSGHARRSQAS
ncbi:hypothetical protein LY05_02110 [Oceanicella actignis]|nr:hypothetical protein LY05_02110 [Oceanicella actignis]